MSASIRVEQMQQVVRRHADDYRAAVAAAREAAEAARVARDQLREQIARGELGSDDEKVQAIEAARAQSRTALAGLEAMMARGVVVNGMAEKSGDIFGNAFGDDESLRLEVHQRAELGDPALEALRDSLIELDSWWDGRRLSPSSPAMRISASKPSLGTSAPAKRRQPAPIPRVGRELTRSRQVSVTTEDPSAAPSWPYRSGRQRTH